MNTKPIIFNGDMVRALLDGRKTQTRRPIKPQPEKWSRGYRWGGHKPNSKYGAMAATDINDFKIGMRHNSPFGRPGDLLWVRETFAASQGAACYCATESGMHSGPWKPSIHMPRWASRLTLRITDVRVERVQDISEEGAKAEGVKPDIEYSKDVYEGYADQFQHKKPFERLWGSIYNDWSDNPWVWVVEFEVLHNNVDELLVMTA